MTNTNVLGDRPSGKAGTAVVRKRRPRRIKHREPPASGEAKRFAAVILDVLAGVRTPMGAAAALGIGLPRYYLWEQQAVAALVRACEPTSKDGPNWQYQIRTLEKEVDRLKRASIRQQALLRAAQRSIGLTVWPSPKPGQPGTKSAGKSDNGNAGKKPRQRQPVVRALKAAAALRAAPPADSSGSVPTEVVQQVAEEMTPPAGPAFVAGSPASPGLQGG